MTNLLDITAIIAQLKASGRTELIHYAGAAHRDPVAWHMCAEYLAAPRATESQLKSRALLAAHGLRVSTEQIAARTA